MTQEEAFELLELPIGSNLQTIRRKFAAMHNDYRMQIDNAFNLTHKHNFEQKLEELKEAYALLNESDGIDDSADLPRTSRSFEESSVDFEHPIPGNEIWTLESALTLFGLDHKQDFQAIKKQVDKHLKELDEQLQKAKLSTVRQAYQQEIIKSKEASLFLEHWMEMQTSPSENEPTQTNISIKGEEIETKPVLWYKVLKAIMIIAGIVMLLAVVFDSGRLIGGFAMSFSWVIATLLSSAIILNFLSSPLVPPFLQKRWLKGGFGLVTLILLLVVTCSIVALSFTFGAKREANPWIHWDYYQEIGYYGLVLLWGLWFLGMLLCFIIGLSNPKTIYFTKRSSIVQVIVLMVFYQIFLTRAIHLGFVFADYHVDDIEDANYGNHESLLEDSVYSDVIVDSTKVDGIEQLKKYAEEGDATSQYHLGSKYLNGGDVEKKLSEAVMWFKKASDQGHDNAQVSLGWCYDNGLGVKKDEKKAHNYYLTAAENGNDIGQFNVGWNFIEGVGTKSDRQRGIAYWKKSALQGNEDAIKGLKEIGITNYK